jgi:hypothetical protein
VERVNLSKASAWELKQVDNTESDKGWKSVKKFIQEFEALTAHIPSYGMLFRFVLGFVR